MSIRPTHSTIGRSNLAAEMSGGYIWNGDPDKAHKPESGPRREARGSPKIRAIEKTERIRKFTELVLAGIPWRKAAEHPEVNVQLKTARNYWNGLPLDVRAKAEQAAARLAEQEAAQ